MKSAFLRRRSRAAQCDSLTLEQWLEQSLPGQAWFANETNIPSDHVRSLDKSWDDWAAITSPPLVGTLFNAALETGKGKAAAWLSKPATKPFIITADSAEEAVAFVSHLFSRKSDEKIAAERDRVIVFDKEGTLPRLMQGAQTFIPVVYTREVERELAPYSSKIHSIVICPRNASNADPDIVIEPTPYETFKQGLEEMGKNRDEISQLDNATVLYIGLKLYKDGTHEVVYNGPGHLIADAYQHRKGIGQKLLSLPIARLRELSASIDDRNRVPRRIEECIKSDLKNECTPT